MHTHGDTRDPSRFLLNLTSELPPTASRVAEHTATSVNDAIRADIDLHIARHGLAGPAELSASIDALNKEWDIERLLQTNASALCLAGLALGLTLDRRFLLLPMAVFGFLAQHAVQGWCPPIPIFRRLGVRTMSEIERERYALKALRGDFDALPTNDAGTAPRERVRAVLQAIDR